MALTWTRDNDGLQNLGPSGIIIPAQAVPAATDYVTGGYAVSPATFGLGVLRGLMVLGVASAAVTTAYLWQYDPTTGKIQVFATGTASGDAFNEVAADTDLSAYTLHVLAYGF